MTFREWTARGKTVTAPKTAPPALKSENHSNQKRSERRAISEKMIKAVRFHFPGLTIAALQDYTFERYHTDHYQAKADLDIFDGAAKLVFQGREFNSGIAGYWRPSRAAAPEWASNEQAWGRPSTGKLLIA